LRVVVDYFDILTGGTDQISTEIVVERGESNILGAPKNLDENLNRYSAAKSIIESIELSNSLKFEEAQKKLRDWVQTIHQSSSGKNRFCQLLIQDLEDCINGMNDLLSFQTGIHSAHAFASMYFLERSSGVMNALRKNLITDPKDIKQVGYGYLTDEQMDGSSQASNIAAGYINKYRTTF